MKTLLLGKLAMAVGCACMLGLLTGCTTTSSTERALVGRWQWQSPVGVYRSTCEFLANGTYSSTQRLSETQPPDQAHGSYAVVSRNLMVLTPDSGHRRAQQFFLAGDELNTILPDGTVSTLKRVKK